MSEFFPRPCFCPVCDKEVHYNAGRRRCSACKRWCHENCSVRNGFKYDDRSTCFKCVDANGPTLKQIEWTVSQLDDNLLQDPEYRDSAIIFTTSMWVGPDEAKIREITKIPPERFAPVAENFYNNRVWKDGKIWYDKLDDPDDPAQFNIMVLILIMCGSGHLVRSPAVESGDVPPEPAQPDAPNR